MNKVWFITGAGRGFGRVWTEAALKRGDSVIATAREPEKLTDLVTQFGDNLLPVMLDVRDRAAVSAAVDTGFRTFGRIDVVVNNAGYGLFCPLENVPENDARQITETNILGFALGYSVDTTVYEATEAWACYSDFEYSRFNGTTWYGHVQRN
ncbi:NADP-dependent 3-hydroxy acid dehydrogenase YdfG [Serratia fonticola]|uniref:NADP-dependent 3-hydroxy acid dehydrogenase YdfG n=1 Tax=Serratia fonticola TaxID=47917 RepID=A0A4U9WJF4_SERFO|nr:NADP-dependent 3-hydroxy acid dehydrogenase YdfG [Serratia fonticola]